LDEKAEPELQATATYLHGGGKDIGLKKKKKNATSTRPLWGVAAEPQTKTKQNGEERERAHTRRGGEKVIAGRGVKIKGEIFHWKRAELTHPKCVRELTKQAGPSAIYWLSRSLYRRPK